MQPASRYRSGCPPAGSARVPRPARAKRCSRRCRLVATVQVTGALGRPGRCTSARGPGPTAVPSAMTMMLYRLTSRWINPRMVATRRAPPQAQPAASGTWRCVPGEGVPSTARAPFNGQSRIAGTRHRWPSLYNRPCRAGDVGVGTAPGLHGAATSAIAHTVAHRRRPGAARTQ